MANTNEHGQIIAAAAKSALAPLGLKRKGRSRLWYADQRFWVIFVEFQPSGWSKGSYLNIAVKWLWSPGPGWSFSYRPMDFIPFTSAEQFRPLIEAMATSAAQEVETTRDRFKTFADVYRYVIAHATLEGWPIYNAAVAAGLAGDEQTARRFFQQMKVWKTHGYDWQLQLKADSAALAALLFDPEKFRAKVLSVIEHKRALMKMPPDPNCLEMVGFQPGQ